jgi:hypothetical protein
MMNTGNQDRAAIGAGVLATYAPGQGEGRLGAVASAALRDWFGSEVSRIVIDDEGAELFDGEGRLVVVVPAIEQHRFAQAARFAGVGTWELLEAVAVVPGWAEDEAGNRIEGDTAGQLGRMATVVLAELGKAGFEWTVAESPYELRWVAAALGMPGAVRVGVDPVAFVSWLCERRPLVAGRLVDAVLLT